MRFTAIGLLSGLAGILVLLAVARRESLGAGEEPRRSGGGGEEQRAQSDGVVVPFRPRRSRRGGRDRRQAAR